MKTYSEYFEIDPQYFPCVDQSAIKAGLDWKKYYPHETFVELLQILEKVLARKSKKSIWIEGAYGTGKSHAAFALRKILECNEFELQEYFNKYADSQKLLDNDLKNKLIGHKKEKIVVAYRYASSDISCDNHLILTVQKTVSKILKEKNIKYKGEHTLQEKIIEWLEAPEHKYLINSYLTKSEYKISFNSMTVDDILNKLKSQSENQELLDKIFKLADDNGITAFKMDMDALIEWLTDIIDKNALKALVLIWDEFSDYFKNNRNNSFSGFQKLVELSNFKPFYFTIVTHQSGSYFHEQSNDRKLIDRFEIKEIKMPEDIAFDLIANALEKKESEKNEWEQKSDVLNTRLHDSKNEVEKSAKIGKDKTSKIMPLHPMAALLLKHISSAYASNQRSMFDFIKNDDSVESFQWFIKEFGPHSPEPLLTIDKLWKFFYEEKRNNLTEDIRSILDTFSRTENGLNSEEKRVLKTVLMMQAIYLKNQAELFETTEKNINLAFDGTELENKAVSIANKLSKDAVISKLTKPNGKEVFVTMVAVSNSEEINKRKEELKRTNLKTNLLIERGMFLDALALTPALKLRFEFIPIHIENFKIKTNEVKSKFSEHWKIPVIVSFSKDELECIELKKKIVENAKYEDYKNIVFINANTYMKPDIMEKYLDTLAHSEFHRGKNNGLSQEFEKKAMEILNNFRNDIANGEWFICHFGKQNGEIINSQSVKNFLLAFAMEKYPYSFDSASNASEAMFSNNNLKVAAECGILETTKSIMTKAEERLKGILQNAWKNEHYWQKEHESPISMVKISLEVLIQDAFKSEGRVSILTIYQECLHKFGYMPCNTSAFLLGFLLKEYTVGNYRYSDGNISEPLKVEKLKDIIGEAISEENNPNSKYKEKFIACITEEEKECFGMLSKVFDIPEKNLNSTESAANSVRSKLKEFPFPIFTLEEICPEKSQFIEKIADFVNPKKEENSAKIAMEIGNMVKKEPEATEILTKLVTNENTQIGMKKILEKSENENLQQTAKEIDKDVLSDINKIFKETTESNWLWDKETGKEQIRKLEETYKKEKEDILNSKEKNKAVEKIETMDNASLKRCLRNIIKKYPHITKEIIEEIL